MAYHCFVIGGNYAFLVTEDVSPRVLGRINGSSSSSCKNRIFLTNDVNSGRRYINVDRRTGIVKLQSSVLKLKKQYDGIRKHVESVKIVSRCGYKRISTNVSIKLLVFPLNFGDSFLEPYLSDLNFMATENKQFDIFHGMASSLHRVMRMVEKKKNAKAFNEMMASAKVDVALEDAIKELVETFIPKDQGCYFLLVFVE